MQEESVDAKLDSYLKEDLKANTERVEVETEKIDLEEEGDNEEANTTIKKEIYRYMMRPQFKLQDAARIYQLMSQVESLTQKEAETYAKALRYSKDMTASDELVDLVIRLAATITCRKGDKENVDKIARDRYVKGFFSDILMRTADLFGSVVGGIVFLLYSVSSHMNSDILRIINEAQTVAGGEDITPSPTSTKKTDNVKTTVSPHGGGAVKNG